MCVLCLTYMYVAIIIALYSSSKHNTYKYFFESWQTVELKLFIVQREIPCAVLCLHMQVYTYQECVYYNVYVYVYTYVCVYRRVCVLCVGSRIQLSNYTNIIVVLLHCTSELLK